MISVFVVLQACPLTCLGLRGTVDGSCDRFSSLSTPNFVQGLAMFLSDLKQQFITNTTDRQAKMRKSRYAAL